MRHMRSRRILAMLLALSMIFGLLTTTALADNEVDQNTSTVGESAANGTSESGSGEGQSSGASDGQPSQETNKKDVPTEEETTPEEKKTTSSEEVDTQVGEGKTPVEETTYVASIGEQGYASLDAAIQAAVNGDTVTLLGNVELTETLTISSKDITLDVGSNTLTVSVSNGDGISVENATLTLESSSTGKYVFACTASGSDGIFVSDNATLNLNGDVEIHVSAAVNSAIHAYAPNGTATVNINAGKITASGEGTHFSAIVVDQNATLNMNGGEFDLNVNFDSYSDGNDVVGALAWGQIGKQENITVNISGGTFKVGGKNAFAQVVQIGMKNGYSENCKVNITGGTVELNPTENGTGYVYAVYKTSYATATISGGTVTGTVTALVNPYITSAEIANDGLTVTGGTFTNISADEMSKYLPEGTTYDATTGTVTSGSSEKLIETSEELAQAIANASDGDTIKLAAGEFTTYGNQSPKKSLIFVGSGEGTVWTIGDLDNTPGGEKNGDYSFDGCDTITFKNMTLKSDGADYRGFIRISNTIVDDCVLSGKTAYWGYETAKFINSKFNAPEGDYALWDYSSKSMSFDGCEFNISGKGVNVYVEAGNAGTDARKVEVKDCTVNSTKEQKAFLNIKNSTQAYDVTISGNNTVNGLVADSTTGSNLYQVETTEVTEASGKPLTVKQVDAAGNETILYQVKKQTGVAKGSETNPYTLEELGAMTRDAYIAAQKELGGTMYVSVGNYDYSETKYGTLGNGTADNSDKDSTKLNYYGAPGAKSGKYSDEAVGKNIIFVDGIITSGEDGYTSIDSEGLHTSLLLAVPAYTNVTFQNVTFNDVMSFNYQLYTSPWSQLGELKFDGCTFNGIIVGAIAAQTLTFNGCTFNNYTNNAYPNNSNPTWIRPAYGNWTESDNKGQGEDFKSLTTINFTNNTVTSTRPVKFEYISQWNNTTTLTATGNSFDISAQEGDTKVKNVGMYFGSHTDENAFNLILGTNEKLGTTAALYTLKENQTSLPVGSTVTDLSGKQIEITDALEWKTDNKITLKTETVPAVKNVAKVGETEYATLEEAIAKAEAGQTVTLIADVNTPETTYVVSKDLTIDLNGMTVTGYGYDGVFQIDGANAKVLIKNGNVVAVEKTGSAGKYAMAVWACAENCEVTLEDLTVTQDITHTDDKQMDMIYTSKGKIIINSGSFTSGTPAWTLNCKDAAFKDGSAKIIVNGGTFTGFDPCNNAAEGKGTSFVAEGVGVDYNENGSFTAKAGMVAQVLDASGNSVKAYKTLAEAFTEASEGQTVRLLANATEDVTIDKNITLDLGGKMLTNTGAGKATITIANGATATVKNGSVVGGTSYYNIQNNGTATFEGLTATAGNTGSSMIDNVGTLTITSGEYTGGLDTIKNEPNAKLTVDGGTFTLTKGASKGFTGVIFNYGELTINDGTFIQSEKTSQLGYAQVIYTDKYGSNVPSTVIKGGTFKNLHTKSTAWVVRASNAAAGATKVFGGSFNKTISADYCADGYIPNNTKDANGMYGVKKGKYVAIVGSTGYETLAAAVKAKINGKTVTLLDDVAENIEIAKAKNFTLDLNGHTINGGTVKDKATITNYGTVTITDSSAAQNGTIKRDDNGTVGETSYYVIRNIGTMTIEQANVTNNSGYKKTNPSGSMVGSSLICNGDDDLGGTLNISGGKFEQRNFIAIKNGALGKLNVTGGTISSGHSAIQNWFEATITGGEINGQLWTDAYIKDESVGHTTIGGSAKYTGEIVMDISGSVKPTLEISGGDLNVTNWRITTAAAKAGAKPAVSGGKFTSAVPENYCADGYVPTKNEDGTYGVKVDDSVAEVGGVKYLSLQAALDAAGRKQTVKLLKDTTENVTMATSDLTLDLNGHTLNGGQVKGKPALTVTARVTVKDSSANMSGTIKREDTAENSGVSSHYVIDVQGGGWLTFESGNVINHSGTEEGKGASLVRVGDDSVEKYPGLNIKGGSFKQDNFIAIKVDRGDLFLNGGTIASKNSYAIENWHRATIKGGTVNGTVSTWVYKDGNSVNDFEISGGTINGNVASVTYDKAEGKTAKVTISGGTVTGTLGTYTYNKGLVSLENPAMATIGVTGGTFTKNPTKYVVEDSTVKVNDDGTFGVEKAYLAKVGDTSYYTMEEAFKAQTASGEAIVLLRDYTTGSSFSSGSINRTVDLNNNTWTFTSSDVNSAAFEINYPNVTLTVKNGKVVSNSMVGLIPTAMGGTIKYPNSGLVFEKVEATANGHSGIETNGGNESVSVTLKDSTLNVPSGFGIYFPSSGKLTIDNSKITAKTLGVQVCSGSLDISGADTKIEVTGDPVPKTENDGAIQDGAAISIVNRTGYKGLDKITVTGGTFKAKSGNNAVKAYNWANQAESDFTESNKVAISGGTFSSAVAPEYCAEGFEPKDNGDGTYGVQPDGNVAEIGSMKYKSLDEALKAAKDGETVKLLKDAELEEVVIRSGRTLDLNGHTLKADYVTYFGGNLVDNSAAHTGLLKVLSADEILFTKNKKIDAMTQIPIYSLEKQGYVFEEIVLRVAPVTNKTPGALQAVYRPRQKDGKTDLSDAQKAMFGRANGHPVTATFRLVYKYKNSNEVQTFEFDFVDTYMDIYLSQNLYMYVTVTGLDIANIETITVTPVLKSAGGQVELVGKTIDTAAVLANLIGQ